MARLVHDLRGRVELRFDGRHVLHDARGAHQRALLSMEELRQLVDLVVVTQVDFLLLGELVPERRAVERQHSLVHLHGVFGIDRQGPVDARLGIPLHALALGIQVEQVLAARVVVPGEGGLHLAVDLPVRLLYRERIAMQGGHGHLLLGSMVDRSPANVEASQ